MFSTNFKKYRMMSGFTQKQVADYLCVTPQSISKWEKGDALPSLEYLPKLAELLECDINAFFAPIEEKAADQNLLYDILILVNELVFKDTKTEKDLFAFEKNHPSSISTLIAFCEDFRKRKTIHCKTLQRMIGCSEEKAQLIMEQLIIGKMVEELDIEGTYYVLQNEIRGLIILLTVYQTAYEKACNPDNDFVTALYTKIDILKSKERELK